MIEIDGLSDFDALASTEGVWMEVRHPTTDEKLLNSKGEPMRIKLIGMDSPMWRAKNKEFMNRRLKKNKLNLGSADQLEAEQTETLAACTVGWEGFINKKDGSVLAFSSDNVYTIYADPKMKWLRDQVNEFVGDRANFLKA